jgi:hypothetical protein
MIDDKNKPVTVEFAPGAFDQFDGSQEELEAFQQELLAMFANMTPEEIQAQSTEVDIEYIEQLMEEDPEAAEQLIRALNAGIDGEGRNLQ